MSPLQSARDPCVAVVDDDETILDSMRLVLEASGWAVNTYAGAEAFLTAFRDGARCDVLLLDPHLAGTNGLDVARALSGSGVPVVVFSARPHSALVEAMRSVGIETVLAKPVDAAVLTALVSRLVLRREIHGAG